MPALGLETEPSHSQHSPENCIDLPPGERHRNNISSPPSERNHNNDILRPPGGLHHSEDLHIIADHDILLTKVFFKPTDTHQLLHRTSFHPRHTAKGVLKSQILRFKRISSSKDTFDEACGLLFSSLRKRGYNPSLMRKMKREIWNNDNTAVVEDNPVKLLPIVIPYNDVGTALSTRWRESIKQNTIFDSMRLVTAYTAARNLRRVLVHSKMTSTRYSPRTIQPTMTPSNLGSWRCNSTKCIACQHINQGAQLRSSHNGRTFIIRNKINCKTSNLVYVITCGHCNLQYVGETSRTLADRINDHLSNIRRNKSTPVAIHFNLSGHSARHFTITGLEAFKQGETQARKIKETTWQHLLQTTHPNGINNLKQSYL